MRSRTAKVLRRLHLTLDIALGAALLVFATVLTLHFDRTFVFRDRDDPLSRRAVSLLSRLDGEIHCTAVVPHDNIFYPSLRKLLLDMKDAASGASLSLEFPDPHVDIARASAAIARNKAAGWCVIFEKDGRGEIVPLDAMVERPHTDETSAIAGDAAGVRFNGEQVCVTALSRLSRPVQPVVYALTGHGERDFDDYDPLSGYSDLAREIRREGYRLESLNLASVQGIPADCDLLFIAGPARPPMPGEAEAIVAWLTHGGRLLLLFDRQDRIPSGWEPVISRLGLSLPNLTVISEGTMGGYTVSVDSFSPHPVGRDLEKSAVIMSSPQALDIDREALVRHRLKAEPVVAAPRKSWGETAPNVLPRIYDPGIDRKGDLVLAFAIGADASGDLGLPLLRAFVVGDSNIGSNSYLGGGSAGNRDLLLNAIDWLTDSGLPLASSKTSGGAALQLNLSRKRQIRFWAISCAAWPLALLAIGFIASILKRLLD